MSNKNLSVRSYTQRTVLVYSTRKSTIAIYVRAVRPAVFSVESSPSAAPCAAKASKLRGLVGETVSAKPSWGKQPAFYMRMVLSGQGSKQPSTHTWHALLSLYAELRGGSRKSHHIFLREAKSIFICMPIYHSRPLVTHATMLALLVVFNLIVEPRSFIYSIGLLRTFLAVRSYNGRQVIYPWLDVGYETNANTALLPGITFLKTPPCSQ